MNKMGGMGGLMTKLPGMSSMANGMSHQLNDGMTKKMLAMIGSMTPRERRFPDIIKHSRKQRIVQGSGTIVQDLNRMLKQFVQMQKMMKKMSKKGGMKNLLRGLQGQLPPGMF